MNSSEKIKNFILDNISKHKRDIIHTSIEHFGVSRQAIHKHMNSLIKDHKVTAYGTTKGRYYELMPTVNFVKSIDIDNNFEVEKLLKEYVLPHLISLERNILEIFEFSTGALLNNISDHSSASKFYYKIYITHQEAHFILSDNGIGIFEHIRQRLNLSKVRLAALELAKGQVVTDIIDHSGDELNAVIHLFDKVKIDSTGISLNFFNHNEDWTLDHSTQNKGSRIHLQINPSSKRTCAEIFDLIFDSRKNNVRIPLKLLKDSRKLVINHRNHVDSVMRNIRDYENIEFDFKEIDLIGPAFANELVRKAREKNRFAHIRWINTNETVDLLMSRALNRQS